MKTESKIRTLRKAKKITLEELSRQTGVAVATLSRMETGKMAGTLEAHIGIARALAVNLSELLGDVVLQEKKVEMKAQGERSDVFVHSDKSAYEILTTNVLNKQMLPTLLKIQPGGQTAEEQSNQGSEKFIFVLEGTLTVCIGAKDYTLDANDTLYFDASALHHYKNNGTTPVRALCVMAPPAL